MTTPLTSSLFQITAADLLAKIVPAAGGDGYTFSIGGDGPPDYDLSEAGAIAIVNQQEAMIESYMLPKYQRLLRRVEGEVAVRAAYDGQTELRATLAPLTWLRIYKNYPKTRAWGDRRPSEALEADEYTADMESGEITLTEALDDGDRIYLDYEHTACGQLLSLKHLAESLAAVEISRRFSYFKTADGIQRFEGWQLSAAGHLRDLRRTDGASIAEFDRIDLVNETRGLSLGML